MEIPLEFIHLGFVFSHCYLAYNLARQLYDFECEL